ncbi:carboxypeptidase-like regulatory domain-containing protein [Chloroflexota bacterium]
MREIITNLCIIILLISVSIMGCSPSSSNPQVSSDTSITGTESQSNPTSSSSQDASEVPDISTPETQSTQTIKPNCGVVSGSVSYFDGMPASGVDVVLFEQGSTTSDYIVSTDINGKYKWSDIPVGKYEIYTGIYRLDSPIL